MAMPIKHEDDRREAVINVGQLRWLVRQHNELQRAAKLALSAIDEYLLGARIDWDDVRRVLARAVGEVE